MNTINQLKKALLRIRLLCLVAMVALVGGCEEDLPEAGSIEDLTPPEANFSFAQFSPDNYLEVTFSNTSTSSTDYAWDFGDGTVSTDLEPIHVYEADGTYTVTLTASDKLGVISTTEMEVTLTEPDAFIPPILENSFEDGQLADGAGDGRDSWRNDDLGGVIQITSSPVNEGVQAAKLPGDPGDQRIGYQRLTVTANTIYELSFYYTLLDDQTGSLTVAVLDGSPVANHQEALAAVLSSTTVNDQSNPDAFVREDLLFASGDNTEIAIYFYNDGSVEGRLDDFSINIGEGEVPPSANFAYAADAGNYQQINFTNNSSNANSYAWDFGDGTTSDEESPSHTYSADDSYTVSLTVTSSAGQQDVAVETVVVAPPPTTFINNPSFDDEAVRDDNRIVWRNEDLESDADAVFGNSTYVLQTSDNARTGLYAGKLPTAENSGDPRRWLYQAIEVEPNTDYKISGWLKNKDANVGSTITFDIYDAPFNNASNIGNAGAIVASADFDASTGHDTNDWVEASITFNSGSSTEIVLFITNDYTLNGDPVDEESETFLDDFSIEKQ